MLTGVELSNTMEAEWVVIFEMTVGQLGRQRYKPDQGRQFTSMYYIGYVKA
jgi:hypothetical protein